MAYVGAVIARAQRPGPPATRPSASMAASPAAAVDRPVRRTPSIPAGHVTAQSPVATLPRADYQNLLPGKH